jgi:hypothetical protein
MTWSGGVYRKGNFASNGWTGDAANSIGIEAGRHDVQDDDFANGINQCLTKDGSNSATADINFGGYKPSNIAAGTAAAPAICAGNDVNTGMYSSAADEIAFATNGVVRANIDSSGNVGVGTGGDATPEGVVYAGAKQLTVKATNSYAQVNVFSRTSTGTYGSTLNLSYSRGTTAGSMALVSAGDNLGQINFNGATGTEMRLAAQIMAETESTPSATSMPGRIKFLTTPNGSLSPVERMRIDSAGRVGIGTNAPSQLLHVSDGTSSGDVRAIVGDATNNVTLIRNGATDGWIRFNGVDGIVDAASNKSLIFRTNAAERMRINAAGDVLINKTVANTTEAGSYFTKGGGATNPATLAFVKTVSGLVNGIVNYYAGTYVGGVDFTNTATAFPTASDYRLKENIVPIPNAVSRLNQLKPVRFNFIAEPDETIDGFLAHEVATVVPNAVSGEKDAVNADGTIKVQALDHSKLIPLLVGALKELSTKVETLESQVEMLQTQVAIG